MKVTDAIGAYGAILSTIIAYRQWRSSRPKITIRAVAAFNSPGFEPVGKYVRVVVANHSLEKAHVRHAYMVLLMDWATWRGRVHGFFYRKGRWRSAEQLSVHLPEGTLFTPSLPATLETGQSMVIWIHQAEYEQRRYGPHVRGVQIAVQDEIDRAFVSKPLDEFGHQALPDNGTAQAQ